MLNAIRKMNNLRCLQAIDRRDLSLIQTIISKGHDFNVGVGPCKMPPVIYHAVQSRFLEAVKLLVQAKCNVNVKYTAQLKTPLHVACSNGDLEIAEELCLNGVMVNVNEVDANGETPLFNAIESSVFSQSTSLIEFLLSQGAQVNVVSKNNITPLMRSIELDAFEVTQLFIKLDSDVDINNLTELKVALRRNNNEIIEILLNYYKKLGLTEFEYEESPVDLCHQNYNLWSMKLAIELGFKATENLFKSPMVLFKTMVENENPSFSNARFCFDYLLTFCHLIDLNHRFAFKLDSPGQPKIVTGNVLTYSFTFNCSYMSSRLIQIGARIEKSCLDHYKFNAHDLPALKLLHYSGFVFPKNFQTKCLPSSQLIGQNKQIHAHAFVRFCEWITLKTMIPRSLKEITRITIRNNLSRNNNSSNKINQLNLPSSVEVYLNFADIISA